MSQETILVTGAAGGVGSNARVAIGILLEQGHRVRAMSDIVRRYTTRARARVCVKVDRTFGVVAMENRSDD